MMEPAIYCEQVSKRYSNHYAINELTLSLPQGGVVGVLGPNGAGKSTFFRLLTGLTKPDSGKLTVLGKTPGWKVNQDIAYLPDRARWYPEHTVSQAFKWAERLLPGFHLDEAEKMAEFMKLAPTMRASGMSRGQEARLMLILCMARDVPLTILDEPFSGIDAVSREQIVASLIDHLSESNRTVLISTHEVYEAESLFDRVVMMQDGQVVLTGEADALRQQYGSINSIQRNIYS